MSEYEHLMQKRASQYIAPIAGGLIGAGLGYMLPSDDEEYEYDKYGRRVKKTKPNNLLKAVNVLGGGLVGAGLGMGAHQLWHSLPGTGWKQKMDGVYNKLTGTTPAPSTTETAQPPAPPQGAPAKEEASGQVATTATSEPTVQQVSTPDTHKKGILRSVGRPAGKVLSKLTPEQQEAAVNRYLEQKLANPHTRVPIAAEVAAGRAGQFAVDALGRRKEQYPGGMRLLPSQQAEKQQAERRAAIREAGHLPSVQVADVPGLIINAPVDDYRPGVANSYLSNEFAQRAAQQMIANGMQGVTKKTVYKAIAEALIDLYGKQYEDAIWNDVDAAYNANKSNW